MESPSSVLHSRAPQINPGLASRGPYWFELKRDIQQALALKDFSIPSSRKPRQDTCSHQGPRVICIFLILIFPIILRSEASTVVGRQAKLVHSRECVCWTLQVYGARNNPLFISHLDVPITLYLTGSLTSTLYGKYPHFDFQNIIW